MTETEKKLTGARFAVLRDQPFFGTILLHFYHAFEASFDTETLATDGRTVRYNPSWLAHVSEPHLQALLAKIAMHIACEHPLRVGDRDIGLANLAMALAVNPILRDAGFDLPPDAPLDPEFDNMVWEQIYSILDQRRSSTPDRSQVDQPGNSDDQGGDGSSSAGKDGQPDPQPGDGGKAEQQDDQTGQPGQDGAQGGEGSPSDGMDGQANPQPGNGQDGDNQPTGHGGADVQPMLEDNGTPALPDTVREAEADNRVLLVQARQAALKAGKLSGGLERLVQDIVEPKASWTDILRRFIRERARDGYSWSRPNRRHAWRGVILPSRFSEALGDIVVAVDTSASFREGELAIAAAEIGTIFADVRPKAVTVIYCDTKVTRTERFEAFDQFEINAAGGGGTRFQPVFDWVEDNLASAPECLIYFTDMQPFDQPKEPEYPVLWAAIGDQHKDLGFGEVLPLD